MDQGQLVLLAELPGLAAAKKAIETRILEIEAFLGRPTNADNIAAPRTLHPLPFGDPSVLGRDVLGRIKRKRNISPELREQKRKLIGEVRRKKLEMLAARKSYQQNAVQVQSEAERKPVVSSSEVVKEAKKH